VCVAIERFKYLFCLMDNEHLQELRVSHFIAANNCFSLIYNNSYQCEETGQVNEKQQTCKVI